MYGVKHNYVTVIGCTEYDMDTSVTMQYRDKTIQEAKDKYEEDLGDMRGDNEEIFIDHVLSSDSPITVEE